MYVGFSTTRERIAGPEQPSLYLFDGEVFQSYVGWYDHSIDRWIKLDVKYEPHP